MKNATRRLGLAVVVLGLMAGASGQAGASLIIPNGVQNDVALSTVTGAWGWTVAYQGDYSQTVSIADMFANTTGQYVMLAAHRKGSNTFEVLAAALKTDVQTYTPYNTTHTSNGVEWYYNNFSIGFAGLGDTIIQSSADINGSAWSGTPERDRLSWHSGGSSTPTAIFGGWRAGAFIELNSSTEWERFVLTGDNLSAVPEPSSIALVCTALPMGLGLAWKRRRQAVSA